MERRTQFSGQSKRSGRRRSRRLPVTPKSRGRLPVRRLRLQARWAGAIPQNDWDLYRAAIQALRRAGIRFMLGGGFALAAFTGRWRNTKDIDFYILPQDRDASVAALSQAGFVDYYDRLRYDRKWIYRSVRSDVIVDMIWSMANQRAQVDEAWFERAGSLAIHGEKLPVISREEFIWCKLYILQRDHCDWTDIFNVLYVSGPEIDWAHLLRRLEDDAPLLKALLTVYAWLCPKPALRLPDSLWAALKMPKPQPLPHPPARDRIRLLDSRQWFVALLNQGGRLEV